MFTKTVQMVLSQGASKRLRRRSETYAAQMSRSLQRRDKTISAVLDRNTAGFTGTDTNTTLQRGHKNLAVAYLPVTMTG